MILVFADLGRCFAEIIFFKMMRFSLVCCHDMYPKYLSALPLFQPLEELLKARDGAGPQ